MTQLKELQRYLGVLPEKKRPQPKRLTAAAKNAIILHLEGLPIGQIAEMLGRSPSWVSWILNSDLAQSLINDYISFVDQEFRALYKLSVEAIRDALQSNDIEVRLKAADRYLKAHGKYSQAADRGETAEDVIKRVMELKITEVYPKDRQKPAEDVVDIQAERKETLPNADTD